MTDLGKPKNLILETLMGDECCGLRHSSAGVRPKLTGTFAHGSQLNQERCLFWPGTLCMRVCLPVVRVGWLKVELVSEGPEVHSLTTGLGKIQKYS